MILTLLFIAFTPGQKCTLPKPLLVMKKQHGKLVPRSLEAGTVVTLVDGTSTRWVLRSGKDELVVETEPLTDACAAPTPAAKPAPSEPAAVLKAESKTNKKRVLVLDFTGGKEIPPEQLAAQTAIVAKAVSALGPFDAFTMDEIRQMVSIEETRQIIGCQSNASCIAEIGGAIGAGYAISGHLSGVDKNILIQLQLINTARAKVESRVSRTAAPLDLLNQTEHAAKVLVREVLALKPGTLRLSVNHEGASVTIDEKLVGATPLSEQKLGGGMHTLVVDKAGFIPFVADVEIIPGEIVEEKVNLALSQEALAAAMQRARIPYAFAWTTAALSVGCVGGAIGVDLVAAKQQTSLRTAINAYNAGTVRTTSDQQSLTQRRNDLAELDALTLALAGSAVAMAATSAALFIWGDSPTKVQKRTSLAIAPIAGGAVFSLISGF